MYVTVYANCSLSQYPMDKNKGSKIPVQIRVNMWLGLVAVEKKFNAYAEGTFNVFTELVNIYNTIQYNISFEHKYAAQWHVLFGEMD